MKQAVNLPSSRGNSRWRRVFYFLALAAMAALAWFWTPLTGRAEAGAAYAARVGCSCRFVAGRPLDQCRDDFLPGMGLVILSEDAQEKSVTARLLPLASETVRFREGRGCAFAAQD